MSLIRAAFLGKSHKPGNIANYYVCCVCVRVRVCVFFLYCDDKFEEYKVTKCKLAYVLVYIVCFCFFRDYIYFGIGVKIR